MKPLSKVKKDPRAAHFWFIFRDRGGYGVCIGPPKDPRSRYMRHFTNEDDLRDWVKYDLSEVVSPDHVIDASGLRLIPQYYTQWYVDNIIKY